MPLLNYTTEIAAEKSVAEIERALAVFGAQAIMKEYDPIKPVPAALSFRLQTKHGPIAFRLPARIDSAVRVLDRQVHAGKIAKRFRGNREQATRVAWRIVKDWVIAQLALIEIEQAEPAELFLAFARGPDGRTLFERIDEISKAGLLTLTK
jgi:hypothetical protein